jgi:hypothetical protein
VIDGDALMIFEQGAMQAGKQQPEFLSEHFIILKRYAHPKSVHATPSCSVLLPKTLNPAPPELMRNSGRQVFHYLYFEYSHKELPLKA